MMQTVFVGLRQKKEYICFISIKSKIFLSFSYAEGFGMPPIEAAMAGNKVIGYTGGGGKEYWRKPIFEEIQSGDIKNFSEKTRYCCHCRLILDHPLVSRDR